MGRCVYIPHPTTTHPSYAGNNKECSFTAQLVRDQSFSKVRLFVWMAGWNWKVQEQNTPPQSQVGKQREP